jgi:hypothetical protein
LECARLLQIAAGCPFQLGNAPTRGEQRRQMATG